MRENVEIEIDLQKFMKLLLKRAWVILLCAILVGTSVLVYTINFVTPMYEASVSIYVNNNSGKDNSYISSSDLAVALRLVATYVNIIQSNTVLDRVIAETGLQLTASQLREMVSAEAMGETEMFRVTVTTPNPQMSADLANAIAAVAPNEITNIIEGSAAKIIDYAKVPQSQSAPSYTLNTILGTLIGAMVAIIVIFIQMLTDVRIKTEEDLTKIHPIPVLGVIPDMTGNTNAIDKKARR